MTHVTGSQRQPALTASETKAIGRGASIACGVASRTPDPKEIVRCSVQAIQADRAQAPSYSFEERDVESKHNARAIVKAYQVRMIDGSPYRRVIALNDRPLLAGEQADEERKLRAEIHKRDHESNRKRARRLEEYEKSGARIRPC